jgi:hypothetical protein
MENYLMSVKPKSGRPHGSRTKISTDEEVTALIDLLERGATHEEAGEVLDASPQTIAARVVEIQEEHGVLLQYRAIQSLELTKLQAKVLMAITDEKINDASLSELVNAFKILKDKELTLEGKPSDIKGLVGYLIQLEKEEAGVNTPDSAKVIEAEVTETKTEVGDQLPNL